MVQNLKSLNLLWHIVNDDMARFHFGKQARLYAEENLARDSVLGRLLEQLT